MYYKLDNGMGVYLFQRKNLPLISLTTVYGVGSFNEQKHEQGVAHFLEHMMFKGSKKYPLGAIDLFSHVSGGENNAYTCKDYTAYYHLLPKGSWQEGLNIEKDRMTSLDLDQGEFDSEKQVVIEELKMYQDEAQELLYDAMYESLYAKSSGYFHPVLGYEKTLNEMTLQTMQSFYEKYYQPANSFLILLGDFEIDDAKEYIHQSLSQIPSKAIESKDVDRCFHVTNRKVIQEMEQEYPSLQIAFPSNGFSKENYILSSILEEYLCGGKIGRFYQLLCEQNDLVNSVQSFCDSQVEGGAFFFNFELKDIQDIKKILTIIYSEFENLHNGAFDLEELEIAKTKVLANYCIEQEKLDDYTMSLIPFCFYSKDGDAYQEYHSLKEAFSTVSALDMTDYIQKHFDKSKQVVGLVRDIEESDPDLFLWEEVQ
ncbi:MAG: insulinase family protein [Candidatus Cloacimonetes bacterium]|nr:insulinase family protein [Candidatus Cloacimonadota bacterium]